MSPLPNDSSPPQAAIHSAASHLLDLALNHPDPTRWLQDAPADPSAKREALRLLELHFSAGETFLSGHIQRARAAWAPATRQPGELLAGRYLVERLIGEGGMGEVFLVQDQELNQSVALKTLKPHLANDPINLERFRREVLMLRDIHHQNVIRIFDFGRDGGTFFYTMEFLEGESLSNRLHSSGPLDVHKCRFLALNLLDALAAIHSRGIVHRDLKPSNIFLTSNHRVVLMDFGIASAQGQATLTDANSVLGSLDYMAPEQLDGGPITPRSDFFSFGLVLYEALTGSLAFSGTSPVARAIRRLQCPSPKLEPTGTFASAISACLEFDPANRPATSAEIVKLIDNRPPLPWVRILAICSAILLALALWKFWPSPKPVNPEIAQHLKLASQFAARRTSVDLENARAEFDAVLKLDPNNVEAYTGLAEVFSTIANFGFADSTPTLAQANLAAKKALKLSPDSGAAQAVQAYIISLNLKNWRTADPLFRRAVSLDPSQTRTRLWYGAYLSKLGRFEEALAQLRTGLSIDPGSMPLNVELVSAYSQSRQFEAAESAARNLVRIQPREPSSHLALCRALLARNRPDLASPACIEALRLDNSLSARAIHATVLAAQGKLPEARKIARSVESSIRNVSILCDLYARIGETERAIALVEKAFAEGDSTVQLLGFSHRFDAIRGQPRIQQLIIALGFTPGANSPFNNSTKAQP